MFCIIICSFLALNLAQAEEAPSQSPQDVPEVPQSFEEKHKDKSLIFILYDVAVELKENWSYTIKVHKKIKILKEDAKDMGEIPLAYTKGKEKVVNIKAFTITPDGKRHRYSKIQDFKTYEGYAMYSDSMLKIITLPEVNIGSILEHEATVVSKSLPIKNAFWRAFNFTSSSPIKELNYTVTLPKKFDIQYMEFNLEYKPKITENRSTITYAWHIEDMDDYRETEDYLPPPDLDSVRNCVEFSSIKSWSDISDWYWALIKKNLKITPKIEEATKKVLNGHVSTKDKVRAILEYIQENFRYVSMSFGDHTLEPHPTNQVFRNKYGDCKDLSLLCMAMLKLAGVKSYIALFNDEFSITDPQYDPPIPSLFNHVLLLVEDPEEGDFYIDPLLDGYDISQYPLYYQNAYTFIITEDGGRFGRFPIFDEKRDYSEIKGIIAIWRDGSALIATTSNWELDFSIKWRKTINEMDDEKKKRFFQMLDAQSARGGEMLVHTFEGLGKKYGPIRSYAKMNIPDLYPITDDMMIINIAGYERGDSFLEEERKNPIFYPGNYLKEDKVKYRIPDGFRISHIPEDLDLDIGFFSFKREYKRKGNEITVAETTRYKRKELPKEDYNKVKAFYDNLPAETNQRIVLKKIKPWWEEIKDFIGRFKKGK